MAISYLLCVLFKEVQRLALNDFSVILKVSETVNNLLYCFT